MAGRAYCLINTTSSSSWRGSDTEAILGWNRLNVRSGSVVTASSAGLTPPIASDGRIAITALAKAAPLRNRLRSKSDMVAPFKLFSYLAHPWSPWQALRGLLKGFIRKESLKRGDG